jgi:lysophospholipase L1-like esterase
MSRLRCVISVVAAVAGLLAWSVPAQAAIALPNSMASAGDSITRGYDATWWGCFLRDCPQYSWSTGTSTTVNSHYSRILAANPGISGHAYNDARTGAKMVDLDGQLNPATPTHAAVDYVTVLMGANDVCTSDTAHMTPSGAGEIGSPNYTPGTVRQQLNTALSRYFAANGGAHLYLSSLPNVVGLYNALQTNSSALSTWKSFNICQSALPPGGTDASRALVLQREQEDNRVLAEQCSVFAANCLYDGGAGFGATYSASCISTVDYFHPSPKGQAFISQLTWAKSYWGGGAYTTSC